MGSRLPEKSPRPLVCNCRCRCSMIDVTLISKKGKRYEKVVDIEEGGGENKKVQKAKKKEKESLK